MSNELETEKFFRIGNNLSLDFINTEIIENGAPKDLLADVGDLAAWAAVTELIEKSKAEILIAEWKSGASVDEEFARAKEFRQVLREMFVRLAAGKSIGKTTLAAINQEIQNKSGAFEIRQTETGFEKSFRADFRAPARLLAPIAESAADLLCYGDLARTKKCEARECVLYFYDTTKNHSRRWCSMQACGNRHKAAAFYQRRKSS